MIDAPSYDFDSANRKNEIALTDKNAEEIKNFVNRIM
jgi:hypothetical protein